MKPLHPICKLKPNETRIGSKSGSTKTTTKKAADKKVMFKESEQLVRRVNNEKCVFSIYPTSARLYGAELYIDGQLIGKTGYNIGNLPLSKLKEKLNSYTDLPKLKKDFRP